MNKLLLLFSLATTFVFANEIPIDKTEMRSFGKSINVNAQIIQLQNTRQTVASLIEGRITKYYVKPGQKIVSNQKIALIDSIVLSEMTGEFLSLKEQYAVLNKNYIASKKLYEKGMLALQDLNRQMIEKDSVKSKITKLKTQLSTLGINVENLNQTSSQYTLYSHSEGIVNDILQPLNGVVGAQAPIVTISKENALYAKAYIPLRYANVLKLGQTGKLKLANHLHDTSLTQILPEVDSQTQRIIALFAINDSIYGPHINAFAEMSIYLTADKEYVSIKKSALSFFQNEWVVFIPKQIEEADEHNEHEQHQEHDEHDEHDEHEGHQEHDEHTEAPYEINVVEILMQDDDYIAVKGLDVGQKYVSDKSYYVKSMLLKSSLGGHGH